MRINVSTLDTRIDTVAWAMQRWRTPALQVTGFGGSPELAQRRGEAVAAALRAHGLRIVVATADAEALRAQVREHGSSAARSATLQLHAGN